MAGVQTPTECHLRPRTTQVEFDTHCDNVETWAKGGSNQGGLNSLAVYKDATRFKEQSGLVLLMLIVLRQQKYIRVYIGFGRD